MILWDKLTTCRDLTPCVVLPPASWDEGGGADAVLGVRYREGERLLHLEFMRLPSRKDYADYYEMIKKPIS